MIRLDIRKRPAAERDIEECFVYIAQDNLDAGLAFLVAIEDALERLATMPRMGVEKTFGNKTLSGIRMLPLKGFDAYLLFYLADDAAIDLIRVLHGSRDIDGLFD